MRMSRFTHESTPGGQIAPEYGAARYVHDGAAPDAPEGSFAWGGSIAKQYDVALHKHVSPDGSEWAHRHTGGTDEHYHEPHRDLSALGTDEIERELGKRKYAEQRARQEAAVREAQLQRDMQDAKDAEFAKGIGITYDQYKLVEDYVTDKFND